ncbi:hypothetical protein RHSIM_RhsimUnG0200900 [Rhododendron simsii]|uniref:CCHC-type domain-containing protein n=1 Tax=Rhododendron simsii TaxID=118357 RepID=A0A834FTZ3_RHOSS|nr:hypothetical protein RHSIM_RhsimUnG0200900 [Rhododendron simsii]
MPAPTFRDWECHALPCPFASYRLFDERVGITQVAAKIYCCHKGWSENRKNSGNRGHSKSKGRGTSTSGRVAKDECAYCREKGHWKKYCPKKRGNDSSKANIVHSDEDDDSNLALLETSMVLQDPIQSVEEDSEVESNDSDTVEGEVPVDSSSQQQQQKIPLQHLDPEGSFVSRKVR